MFSGFDIASRLTGWCSGSGLTLPTAGAWSWPHVGDDLGELLDLFDQDLHGHIERFKPTSVAYEAPLLLHGRGGGRADSILPLRKIYSLGAHLEWVCRSRGIECAEVDIRAVKKELAGFGTAQKSDMVFAAEKLGVALPKTKAAGIEDAADALAVWLLLLRCREPRTSVKFDQALWSSRKSVLL